MKAIFLGKFQPPHLGHVKTIIDVSKAYSKVIVGVTKGTPMILEYDEVKNIFEHIFESNNKIEIVVVEGVVEDGTAKLDELDFDIVVSGNNKVLETLKSRGYETKFQKRTDGIGYSGSEIRALNNPHKNISIEKNKDFTLKIVPTSSLKPLERVLPSHFKNIENMILSDGVMRKPLIVDNKYNVVLDGSHRYAFLVKYGFKYAPVIMVDYDDESIFVGNHLKHRYIKDEHFIISKAEVISRGVSENLFDARTTRHFFPFRKNDFPTQLNQLQRGDEKNIDYLLENISVSKEIEEDLGYISEIDEELKVLESYIKEQQEVKHYLNLQIQEMRKSE